MVEGDGGVEVGAAGDAVVDDYDVSREPLGEGRHHGGGGHGPGAVGFRRRGAASRVAGGQACGSTTGGVGLGRRLELAGGGVELIQTDTQIGPDADVGRLDPTNGVLIYVKVNQAGVVGQDAGGGGEEVVEDAGADGEQDVGFGEGFSIEADVGRELVHPLGMRGGKHHGGVGGAVDGGSQELGDAHHLVDRAVLGDAIANEQGGTFGRGQ